MVQVIPRNEIGLVVPKSQTKFPAPPLGLAIHWEGTQVNQGDLEQHQSFHCDDGGKPKENKETKWYK